jgi:hypothetical protein
MRKSLVAGLMGILFLGVILVLFYENPGYAIGRFARTYVDVTIVPEGKLFPEILHQVTIEVYSGEKRIYQEQKQVYHLFNRLKPVTFRLDIGVQDQSKGFVVRIKVVHVTYGEQQWRSCSFSARNWVWGNRILRITINTDGEILSYKG